MLQIAAATAAAVVSTATTTTAAAGATSLTQEESRTVDIVKRSAPAVVFITNLTARRDAFTLDLRETPQGAGSGFVWDDEGHIVTNFHVIRGAADVQITFEDQKVLRGKVIGYDEDRDIAVLKAEAPPTDVSEDVTPSLPKGTSRDLLVGQKVFAIGNPFGLDHTLTTGVISGLGREILSGNTGRPIYDVIQTDAAINPGNSGGPLLDSSGNVIGINTAIYSGSGTSSGGGVAIPMDSIVPIVEQILKYGRVTQPVLGITFAPDQLVEQLGIEGILILNAIPGGPAWRAGVQPTTRDDFGRLVLGDIIVGLNGKAVKNSSDLYRLLNKLSVGDEVALDVIRLQSKESINLTLQDSSSLSQSAIITIPLDTGGGGDDDDDEGGEGGEDE